MVMTATQAISVTPHDSNDLDDAAPMLYIGTAGDVSVETLDGGTVVYPDVANGYLYQAVTRVNATGTTASDILAVYVRNV